MLTTIALNSAYAVMYCILGLYVIVSAPATVEVQDDVRFHHKGRDFGDSCLRAILHLRLMIHVVLKVVLFWIVIFVVCFRLDSLVGWSLATGALLILCESIVVDCQGVDEGIQCFVEIWWHDVVVISVLVPLNCGGNAVLC